MANSESCLRVEGPVRANETVMGQHWGMAYVDLTKQIKEPQLNFILDSKCWAYEEMCGLYAPSANHMHTHAHTRARTQMHT